MSYAAQTSCEDRSSYGGSWERQRVAELRTRHPPTPWPHVARQVGRNEIDLRRLYEDVLRPPPPELQPAPPEPVAAPTSRKPRSGKDPQAPPNQALVLLTKGEITVPELACRMAWTGLVAKAVMGGLVRGGFAERATRKRPFSTWRITPSGRAKLARMTVPLPRGRPSAISSTPNIALSLLKGGATTCRKLSAHLKIDGVAAGCIIRDLHRRGFIEAVGAASPRVWAITPVGLRKLGRARPWP